LPSICCAICNLQSAINNRIGAQAGAIEVLYHFCAGAAVVTLRVRTPRTTPSVPSICSIIPSACFFECELSEMFVVVVACTPNPNRLYLLERVCGFCSHIQ
jgi:NADH:ubiquinone oxidoreductase subunit C